MPKIRKKRKGLSPRGDKPSEPEVVVDEDQKDLDLLRQKAQQARRDHAALCRHDVNEFAEYVGRDQVSGEPIRQSELQERMQWLADEHSRLILMAFPESGKTTQLGIIRPLWLLGKNPLLRIAYVSKTADNAKKSSRAVRELIEKSAEVAEVFPNLMRGEKWEEDHFIVRRPIVSKDPSVQAIGLGGSIIGSRVDVLVFDDILDLLNTMTPGERKKVLRQIRAALERLSENGVVIFLTNAWHPQDAAHVLEKEPNSPWHVERIAVMDRETGEPTWSEQWSKARIEKARREAGPLDFARAYLCLARDEGESPFDVDAVDAAKKRAQVEGIELVFQIDPNDLPPGAFIVTGVDLAASENKAAALTALVSVLLWPEDLSRQLLWVEAGRWSSKEIRDRILDHDKRYNGMFVVENNGVQRWIFDIISNQLDIPEEERRLPTIIPFRTGRQKAHPQFGVEGLAVEIANGDWIFPLRGPAPAVKEAAELLSEALYYSRGAHTGDRLMGLWFAREGCRRGSLAGRREAQGAGTATPPRETFLGERNAAPVEVRVFGSDDVGSGNGSGVDASGLFGSV